MPNILSAVSVANEFRAELLALDDAAVAAMVEAWQGVEASLITEMTTFAGKFPPGKALSPAQVLRMERYQALYAQIEAQLSALEGVAAGILDAGQAQAAQLGALSASTSLEALGFAANFNQLPVAATQNILSLARAGKPLATLLEPMYGLAADGIIRELVAGVALGRGPREIARRMAKDGLTDSLDHLLLVTRDQYLRAHREATRQRYIESGVVRGYVRRCARQAGRTCIACVALDGKFYELDVPFAEHPQGRCVQIPAVKGVSLRGLEDGSTWFEGLSEDEQIATMGRDRWEAWKAGELPWDKMAVKTNHPVWGPGVRVANVPDGFKKRRKTIVKPEAVDKFEIPINQTQRDLVERRLIDAFDLTEKNMRHAEYLARQVNELGTPTIRVPDDVLDKILDDGRIKSQFETQFTRGSLDPESREIVEDKAFGFGLKVPAANRPIYGYMDVPGVRDNAALFGNVRIQLSDSVRDRASMTGSDSFHPLFVDIIVPAPLNNPHFTSFGRRNIMIDSNLPNLPIVEQLKAIAGREYFEIQVHGGVSLGDIRSIVFPLPPDSGLTAKLDRLGIPWSVE